MEFKSPYKQLERKINTWCNYTRRLDTYGCGCQHDCSYCYAKSLLSFRGLWNAVEPSTANLLNIKNKIKSLNPGDIVRMGGMTDCFQPLELKNRITYSTILWLNKYRIHYLIVTKSSIVSNDEYLKIYDKKLAHFQITITSTGINNYEKCSSPANRIQSIEKLNALGFDTSIRLSPYLYQNIDLKILNAIKCKKILIEFLKVNYNIKRWFDIDYSDYKLKYGGFKHLELSKKIELIDKIKFDQITIGEYVSEHHNYFSKNVNYNSLDCCNLRYKRKTNYVHPSLF